MPTIQSIYLTVGDWRVTQKTVRLGKVVTGLNNVALYIHQNRLFNPAEAEAVSSNLTKRTIGYLKSPVDRYRALMFLLITLLCHVSRQVQHEPR